MTRNSFLPDPFLQENGTRLASPDLWPEHAASIRRLLEKHMYGPWPGHPASVTVKTSVCESIFDGRGIRENVTLRVNDQFDLAVDFIHPASVSHCPVITFNAGFGFQHDCPIAESLVCEGGYGIAAYDREMIRPDYDAARHHGYPISDQPFPDLACCTIMVWGWGHTIVADWLEARGIADALICTGHSRGGKAALCAGIFDERFQIIAPMGSGCGGTGTSRFIGTLDGSRQDESRCETVGRITRAFPDWFSPAFAQYGSGEQPHPITELEQYLPFDAHMLRAACAPRAVFCSEGTEDHWANPFGTQLACDASDPVFRLLGVPLHNVCHYRPGVHEFNGHDWAALADFCDIVLNRPRHAPHDDINVRPFTIALQDYAPWSET